MRSCERLDQGAAFLAWCSTQGIPCTRCTIQNYDDTGRGLGASDEIPKGAVILSVPDDAVLMPETCSIAEVRPIGFLY